MREFVEKVFGYLDLDWERHAKIDPHYFRPTEVNVLLRDATKAREMLSWEPRIRLEELVRGMVDYDLELARQERTLTNAGHVFRPRGVAAQ